jgi:hypothetical protein
MRYRLRTLLIVLALGPLVLAGAWCGHREWEISRGIAKLKRERDEARWAREGATLASPT